MSTIHDVLNDAETIGIIDAPTRTILMSMISESRRGLTPLSRNDYEVVLFMAKSSGATLDETRMELTNALVEAGWNYQNARALLALFQVLAVEAGVDP